jgi:hypothetical protein
MMSSGSVAAMSRDPAHPGSLAPMARRFEGEYNESSEVTVRMAWRMTMSDQDALIDQLRRSNRRWKVLASIACSALLLAAALGYVSALKNRMQVERELRAANEALANAEKAVNPGRTR